MERERGGTNATNIDIMNADLGRMRRKERAEGGGKGEPSDDRKEREGREGEEGILRTLIVVRT
jgi:hypothetical protein